MSVRPPTAAARSPYIAASPLAGQCVGLRPPLVLRTYIRSRLVAEVAWRPTPEYVENANVTRLMRAHGVESIDDLRRRSVEEMDWFWDAVVKDLGIEFTTPYE